MKKRLLTWLLFLPFAAIHSQNISIKGRVIEQSGEAQVPVAYATVALLKEDSTLVSGVACGQDGKFSVEKVSPGDYLLVVSYVGYNTVGMELKNLSRSLDVGDLLLSESAVELEGVTVSASSVINKVDRKIIFPNQMEVNSSMNGVDLLANMQLSGIEVSRISNGISGTRGGRVELRINGAPATVKDVISIKPKDVIRIEHHDEPSLRYGNAEAVIDYIVRQRETGGSVMLMASHSPSTRWADDFVNSKVNYRKSEFSLSYLFYERGFNKSYRDNEEIFNFQDGSSLIRIEEGHPIKSLEQMHDVNLNYIFTEPDKSIFTAKFAYNRSAYPRRNSSSFMYEKDNREQGVEMTDFNKSHTDRPSLDLYYQHNLKNNQLIALNLVGTFIDDTSERTYREEQGGIYLTDIYSHINGEKYSVIGEGVYEKSFDFGRISVGLKHTQSFSNNTYIGSVNSKTDMTQSYTYFYAEWMGKIKKLTYAAGVGGTHTGIDQDNQRYSDMRFNPSLLLSYQLTKNLQVRYRGQTSVEAPSLGDLNDVEQIIDSLQIRQGNPMLKPVANYINRLSFTYNKSRYRINLDLHDHYAVDPIMESTYREDNKFIRTMENQTKWHHVRATAALKINLIENHLSWWTNGGLDWYQSSGPNYDHTLSNWFIRTNIQANWKNIILAWDLTTYNKSLKGETIATRDNSTSIALGYRWKNLQAIGFMVWPIQSDWTRREQNLSKFASRDIYSFQPELKGYFMGRLTWNFDFGRKYKSTSKRFENSDKESGVMDSGR